ncbi:MAG: prenyltransferase/squalene oxidase repeat-containing protein [Pirellulales bacterium]
MAHIDPRQPGPAPTPSIGVPIEIVDPAVHDHWFPPQRTEGDAPIHLAPQIAAPSTKAKDASVNVASAAPVPARPIPARPIQASPIAAPVARPVAPLPATPLKEGQAGPDEEESSDDEDAVDVAARTAPPWLLSTLVHMLVLIILGLMSTIEPNHVPALIELDVYGDSLGDDLLDASVEIAAPSLESELEAPASALVDLPEFSEPLPTLLPAMPLLEGSGGDRDLPAPDMGYALSGRDKARKKILLGKYGGTDETEKAVERALAWLKRNQRSDGSWSLMGPYEHGGVSENTVAATAMALLAFQGAGHTHQTGEYQPVVEKAWKYLLRQQNGEGLFTTQSIPNAHFFYTHGQATIAVCEIYGMTKDSRFRPAAERAIQYCIRSQFPDGGWRYAVPRKEADTSVTGWIVMGLQSAKMGGIEVPQDTFDNVSKFLDSVAKEDGSQYAYQAQDLIPRDAMTAEGLLCRQYLGWKRDDPRLVKGVEFLTKNLVGPGKYDVYYWYYATQVCHHMEGEAWEKWNAAMRVELPAMQVKTGAEAGSWEPDEWGSQVGRLYTTCLSTYMLEVYYRHLPLYTKVFEVKE